MPTIRDLPPARRALRVFNLDPMYREGLLSTATLSVPWEPLGPGPVGERLEVIDFDPVRRCFYQRIKLDDPAIVAQNGLPPDERDPRMHQQMVYAVASRVLEAFDRALGKRVHFRTRLRLFPHAFYGVNAQYYPDINAVLFGYFNADESGDGILAGQPVFACLSHDIIAHETTHAVTYRLRPRYQQRSNPDVQAWSEGIADLVALLLHFQLEGVLESVVHSGKGQLGDSSPLVEIAGQFGRSTRQRAALRSALTAPGPSTTAGDDPYTRATTMVAAVFRGFLRSYEDETRQLIRLATNGSGVLPAGDIPAGLSVAICEQARQLSDRLLTSCIRAFDYLPPTDVRFGDYLRAVVTADFELFPNSHSGLRQRVINAFHQYGITVDGVWSLTESALRLDPAPPMARMPVDSERVVLDCVDLRPRGAVDEVERSAQLNSRWLSQGPKWAKALTAWGQENAAMLGLRPDLRVRATNFHTSVRFDEDAQARIYVIAQFLQPEDVQTGGGKRRLTLWGGATVVCDAGGTVRYVISRPVPSGTGAGRSGRAAMVDFLDAGDRRVQSFSGLAAGHPAALLEALEHGS